MVIEVVNRSTLVNDVQARAMVEAVDEQVASDFAKAWGIEPSIVELVTAPTTGGLIGDRYGVVYLLDTIADAPAGVLGFHTEGRGGTRTGFVAAKPELDNGGEVTSGDWSVSSVLSHEVLELLADPACSFWSNHGPHAIALEVCDPVEAPTYEVSGVSVSNFVTPAWFDNDGVGPFDNLGLLARPFSLLPGGYIVQATLGAEAQVFGAAFPEWRRAMKREQTSRTSRRLAQLVPPVG